MTLVVDSSAIASVLFGEPEGPTVREHCRDRILLAPGLIDFELANVAVKRIRRNPERELWVLAILSGLAVLGITRHAVPIGEAVALARRTGLSAYDASYLWLALSQNAELLTLDQQLLRASRTIRGGPA